MGRQQAEKQGPVVVETKKASRAVSAKTARKPRQRKVAAGEKAGPPQYGLYASGTPCGWSYSLVRQGLQERALSDLPGGIPWITRR